MPPLIFLVIVDMCFATQKKELINLKNTLNEIQKNGDDTKQWILDFSIVKLVSIWEQIIRDFSDKSLLVINNNKEIKIEFNIKLFYAYVWRSWRDDKQQNLANKEIKLQVKEVKKYSEIRNKVAHGNTLKEEDRVTISNMTDDNSLLNKTLKILENL